MGDRAGRGGLDPAAVGLGASVSPIAMLVAAVNGHLWKSCVTTAIRARRTAVPVDEGAARSR